MISIFNGREHTLTGTRKRLFIQFEKEFLDRYLPCFRHNNSSDSLVVFLAMVGHIDANGWCFPGHDTLHRQTGIRDAHTMGYLISVLNTIVLPMPEGAQKLLNYYSGRLPNGHMKSYYHLFPGAGNADLSPEPFIDKELMRPGLVHRRKQKRRAAQAGSETPQAPDEGACSLEPYVSVPHVALPHEALPHEAHSHINQNQESINQINTRSASGTEGRTLMSLAPVHITVEQLVNKTRQRALTYPCDHCQATITQHHTACPECGAAIVWDGNDVLARDARHAALAPRPEPVYTGAALWLLEFARAHRAGTAGERIFYREDRAHHEAADINRYAILHGEAAIRDKARWALEQKAVGRGLIVTVLNALNAHNPTRRPAGAGKQRTDSLRTDDASWQAQAEAHRRARGGVGGPPRGA